MGSTGKGVLVCVNKFSVKPSSQYSYSEMGSKIFYRCFEVDDVGVSPQANPSRPRRGQKLLYPYTREGSPQGGQTRSSLAGGSQPIALLCRSKAAATDQEASRARAKVWHWSSILRRQTSFSSANLLEHPFIKLMNSDIMKSREDLRSYL